MTRGQVYAGKAVILIDALDRTDRTLATVEKKFKALGNTIGAMGRTTFGAGFFGGLGATTLLARFAKYDDLILELRTKMGLLVKTTDEQEQSFARLERRIRDLGKSTSFTTQEVTQGAIRLAQAGFSGVEIEDTLQSVLDLARGTSTDLGNAATVLANTIRTYGLNTTEASEITSQFVRATRMGTIEIDDLAESLKYASATAVTLGQSLPEVLAIFTLLSDKGMRGSISGTSLNTAFGQIAKKKDDIKAAFGFDVPVDSGGNLLFKDFLVNLQAATQGMNKLERTAAFQSLFNLRGARSVLPIANEQDIQRLLTLISTISSASDEARQAAIVMDSGLGGAFRRAVSAVDDLVISLGKLQSGPLMSLLNTVPQLAGALDILSSQYQGFTLLLAASPGIALAAGAGMIGLSMVLKRLGTAFAVTRKLLGIGGLAAGTIAKHSLTGKGIKGAGSLLSKLKGKASLLGQYPTGAATILPGAASSQRAATAFNARLTARAALYQTNASTSAMHASNAFKEYQRNTRFARSGSPFAAQHAQRAAAAKAAFRAAQANKKAAQAGASTLLSRRLPVGSPLAVGRGASMLKTIGNLGKLSKTLLTLGATATRFVFSINGVTTILAVLLTFGDKIPYLNGVLERLGNAFKTAFGVIGSIANKLGPSFNILSEGFGLLGSNETSKLGFSKMVTGLQTIVTIVSGSLKAAWHGFFMELGSTWDRTKQLVGTAWELFKAVSSIATVTIGEVIGSSLEGLRGLMGEITTLFTGEKVPMGDLFETVTRSMAALIVELTTWGSLLVLEIKSVSQTLEENVERIGLKTIATLKSIAAVLPGGSLIAPDGSAKALASLETRSAARRASETEARASIEESQKEFYSRMESLFTSNTFVSSREKMNKALDEVNRAMGLAARTAMLQPQQFTSPGGLGVAGGGGGNRLAELAEELAQIRTSTTTYVAQLVGSGQNTRGNIGRGVTKEEIKEQTEILKQIRDELELQNNRGGDVFRP